MEIFEQHRQYLGFSWEIKGQRRYFVFNVLLFGISTAGYVFTKLTRVPVTHWRSQGKKIVMFLDDGIGGCPDVKLANEASNAVKSDLLELGFLLAHEKCDWAPSSNAIWLGLSWDFASGDVHVTDARIHKLEELIESILLKFTNSGRIVPVRGLAGAAGQIIFMQHAVGMFVQLQTKEVFNCINSRASWNAPMLVTNVNEAVAELEFWYKDVDRLNGIPISLV